MITIIISAQLLKLVLLLSKNVFFFLIVIHSFIHFMNRKVNGQHLFEQKSFVKLQMSSLQHVF